MQTFSLGYGIGTRRFRYGWSAPRRVSSTFVPPKRTVTRKTVQFRPSRYARYAQYVRGRSTRTKAEVQAQGRRLLAEARARSAAARKRKNAERKAGREARALRKRRIAAKRAPRSVKAGVKAWREYSARTGVKISDAGMKKVQRTDKMALMRAVRGKLWVTKDVGSLSRVGIRPGISWMFQVAYGGDMPYWEDWYNKTMTATQIARRVAADYVAEIQRRTVVQAQNVRRREAWQDTGKVGPKPQPSSVLLPEQAPQAAPAPQRRAAGPASIVFQTPSSPQGPAARRIPPKLTF